MTRSKFMLIVGAGLILIVIGLLCIISIRSAQAAPPKASASLKSSAVSDVTKKTNTSQQNEDAAKDCCGI